MKDFSDILICSDFDGTVYDHGISDTDAQAVAYFQERGGAFTLCTGRPPYILNEKKITKMRLNAPIICMNGACIYDEDKKISLFEDFLPLSFNEHFIRIANELAGYRLVTPCYFDGEPLVAPHIRPEEIQSVSRYSDIPLYKLVFHSDEESIDPLTARLNALFGEECTIVKAWPVGVEILNLGATKGRAARRLADILGRKRLICVGDYCNDISMIDEADEGFAVANACDELKAVSDNITKASVGEALAEIIYSL